jgi:hypothetical protein
MGTIESRLVLIMKKHIMYRVILTVFLLFSTDAFVQAQQIGIWTSANEITNIPVDNCAWRQVIRAADNADPRGATVSDQNSNNNAQILACAIFYAKTKLNKHKDKVIHAIEKLVSAGKPSMDTLAWSRETAAYVMAADLVGYRTAAFEDWCRNMAEVWVSSDGRTMLKTFKERPNNWGAHAFASLSAIYSYLHDYSSLKQIRVFWIQAVTGPKPKEMRYGSDLSWHLDKQNPKLINPSGSVKEGINSDGIIPDDMRRGGSFRNLPEYTSYPWEHLQGLVAAARILDRMGMPIWDVDHNAIYRAAYALQIRLAAKSRNWKAEGDDEWLLPFLDEAYGTDWSSDYNPCTSRIFRHGKNAGWGWITLQHKRKK